MYVRVYVYVIRIMLGIFYFKVASSPKTCGS